MSQTLEEGEAQLTYLWEREKKNSLGLNEWTPCGKEKVCELSFNPEDVNPLAIRLRVQDHREDGSEWYKQLTVQPIVPYSRSWFVLRITRVNVCWVPWMVKEVAEWLFPMPTSWNMGKICLLAVRRNIC